MSKFKFYKLFNLKSNLIIKKIYNVFLKIGYYYGENMVVYLLIIFYKLKNNE